ncbi:MAG: hypothetical protein FJ398_21565 [Verrucomicrobia bacterium]|nr:hypothetical protein [Verrucomicrobiota bacterium]
MKNPANSNPISVGNGQDGSVNAAPAQDAAPKAAKGKSSKKRGAATARSLGSSSAGRISVEYLNPTAREVFIAGSFNGWDPRANALTAHGDGKWGIELALQPGRYEYRLVVDGQWTEDPKAPEHTANPYGGLNSVLQV